MRWTTALLALAGCLLAAVPARAASLQVSPVSVDLTVPAQASAIMLSNLGDQPMNVQIRIFRWTQSGGQDVLTPTTDVVASPPAATIPPGTTYTVRLARLATGSVAGEESYRLIVDQLPDINVARPTSQVSLVMRYSIPVFFAEASAGADLGWRIWREGGRLVVEADNDGDRHAKIADLALASPSGHVSLVPGLAGYVLPGSTRRWIVEAEAGRVAAGAAVTIVARGDDYDISQPATVESR